MANEASIRVSLQINKGNLQYQNKPTNFQADISGTIGMAPGGFTASTAGTDVDFSKLTNGPGLCVIKNLDTTNFITVGIWDGEFHPLLELLPGESYVIRISRQLGSEYGVGTGTSGSGNTLQIRADTTDCPVSVEAAER